MAGEDIQPVTGPSPTYRRRVDGGSSHTGLEYSTMTEEDGKDGIILATAPGEHTTADSHTKSLVKGLTWRFLATSTTTVIAWLVTGEIGFALQIGFLEFFAKLAIYYIHERIWTDISR